MAADRGAITADPKAVSAELRTLEMAKAHIVRATVYIEGRDMGSVLEGTKSSEGHGRPAIRGAKNSVLPTTMSAPWFELNRVEERTGRYAASFHH